MAIKRDPNTLRGQEITSDGQALVLSETHIEARYHSDNGHTYMLASGFVTHINTVDTYTAVMWFQNDSTTANLYVGYMRSCNEVAGKWRLTRGVTAMSNSVAVVPQNMNFGSAKTLTATVEAGNTTGAAFTGGTLVGTWIQGGPAHSDPDWQGAFILAPGASMGLEFAPFATASSNEACTTIEVWQPAS